MKKTGTNEWLFCKHKEKGRWWFRVLGIGLSWQDIRSHSLLFSERNGYNGFRIGVWFFRFLPYVKLR